MRKLPLVLNKVEKSFKDGEKVVKILDELSFEIAKGEVVAVIGPSGSGKSTFLSIAGALLTPDNGDILVNGKNIVHYSNIEKADVRMNSIGYIFQTSNLVPYLRVEEQLSFVLKMSNKWDKSKRQNVMQLLKSVGIEHRTKHFPHQLSGGEKQRVAIARAFVNNPDLILADEPTASLDSERSLAIISLVSSVVKEHNKAAIIVTHDEQILPFCDRIYYMKDGKLIEH